MQNRTFKKVFPFLLLAVLASIAIYLRNCRSTNNTTSTTTKEKRGLNRNPSNINYSKHARCRMDCRHIDETEVKDMLQNGKINYAKSDLQGSDCNKKYAVEGYSKDNQHLRIIFAPCNDEVTVVTCIDIGEEWSCNCEGDVK